ncbi:hypothetical protein TNCT_708761 [Trichonephila clavata]|uniref:Uncharacterized protein n=1 Tax=Trichonephila clavata TaxID=2740835 RepID=A0A8X6GR77_TRICU|nr:hypothetical protein TNCT_708761 [Trichonephila clavata]
MTVSVEEVHMTAGVSGISRKVQLCAAVQLLVPVPVAVGRPKTKSFVVASQFLREDSVKKRSSDTMVALDPAVYQLTQCLKTGFKLSLRDK